MKYKKLVLIASLMLPLTVFAVPGDVGYNGPQGHNMEHLTKELSLTPDQKSKLEAIFKEQFEKFRAIHEETHSRIKEVLSADQVVKWEQIINQRKEKRHQRFGDPQKLNQ